VGEVGTVCYRVAPGSGLREAEGGDPFGTGNSEDLGAAYNKVSQQISSNACDLLQCPAPNSRLQNVKTAALSLLSCANISFVLL
jgi:hypothetical protein